LSSAYHAAVSSFKSSDLPNASALVADLGNNAGFGTGIEYRDNALRLGPKNELPVQDGMTFKVAEGSERLKDAQNGPYVRPWRTRCMFVGGTSSQAFTVSAQTEFQFTNYGLGGDGEVLTEDGADN
jgi:hypothetical protein